MRIDKDHFRGCLLGGATGDAKGYDAREGGRDLISDNTQLSIFTVDGIVWADERAKRKGVYAYVPGLFYSYQKWYYTQTGGLADKDYGFILNGGEVLRHDELFARRGEGVTSLNALASSIKNSYGTIESRINNLNGPGCVCRAAPIGLYFANDPDMAFRVGCESAALTHGHTEAIMSAGYMAVLIAHLAQGKALAEAAAAALKKLGESAFSDPLPGELIRRAIGLSETEKSPRKAIEAIGEGWIAPEAAAIATYLAFRFGNDFEGAIDAATDFNGNTDSIAPACGNIIGCIVGSLEIPIEWILDLELAGLTARGADLLLKAQTEYIGV
ncbi:MAG: ADP-ribosylglycohydrolase family protein [Clostridiales Family XIII bacterium]|jgi:ADP-ribosylglycohydrolase|nr:ADP-ribosylglycohydrolase family protein [Clostridiales Family XIII bacterium]